ncbi:metabotropic glutamate receptor 3-like [Amphiura filiformis]|uniref:metabotropic glutamate receptor 3-like n=1 Tax=Amphiura filiformis TaxID=82378 RepID=UPI003B20C955
MVESMTYAISVINNQENLLPNVTLGYEIRNDCSSEEVSLWTMITLASGRGSTDYENACPTFARENVGGVAAVIGTSRSSTSLLAAKVGGIYDIPVISYYATSDELSNSKRFPYFFRTVPPDKFQVNAIVDILLHYNWKYIALFYSIDSYGIHGARQIQTLAERFDICITTNLPVSNQPSETEVQNIADRLKETNKVTVIVIFSLWKSAHAVLRAIEEFGIDRKFTFIGSDGWGPDVDVIDSSHMKILHGSLFIRLHAQSTMGFHQYYQNLPFMQENASQWYRDKLNAIYVANNCTDWGSCPIPIPHLETQVINAVFAIAYALDASVKMNCATTQLCTEALGENLQRNLLNVSFINSNVQFSFYENGDPFGKYTLKNWQMGDDNASDMATVGFWNPENVSHRLFLDSDNVQWGLPDGEVPFSLCVDQCNIGQIPVPLEKKCCWGCRQCAQFAIVVNGSECQDCPITHWPNANFTICLPIQPVYLRFDHPVFLLTVVFFGIGLILTCVCGLGMYYHRQHPLIKASSIELSGVNIIGLSMSCAAAVSTIFRPSRATCITSDFLFSICFCVTFAPILLKVNRIWRIFTSAKRSAQRPRFVNPKHQLIIITGLITLQIAISCLSALISPSKAQLLIPVPRQQILTLYCQLGTGFAVSTTYNIILILLCCFYAFKARKVPDNYNESRFIAISVYSTLIVCLAAIPVYSTAADIAQMVGTFSVVSLFNVYLTLICLYLPKFYAIQFEDSDEYANWRTSEALHSNVIEPSVAPIPITRSSYT